MEQRTLIAIGAVTIVALLAVGFIVARSEDSVERAEECLVDLDEDDGKPGEEAGADGDEDGEDDDDDDEEEKAAETSKPAGTGDLAPEATAAPEAATAQAWAAQASAPAAAAFDSAAEGGTVDPGGDLDPEARKTELSKGFEAASRLGAKLSKAQKFDRAAKEFDKCIAIAEELGLPTRSFETLHGNRSACREKAGDMDGALEDCSIVLSMRPGNTKVRKRRMRIYEASGRHQDALVEVCALLVADTVEMRRRMEPLAGHPQAQAAAQQAWAQEKGQDHMETQNKLAELMALCGKAKSEALLEARKSRPMPPLEEVTSESSVFQLLLSYTEYLDQEDAFKAANLEALSTRVAEANSAEGTFEKLGALKARAFKYMTMREYKKAGADLMAAYFLFSASFGSPTEEAASLDWAPTKALAGEEALECAALLRFVALFHHVRYDLEAALAIYRAAAALCKSSPKDLSLVEVMRSGVLVDKGDVEGAAKAMEAAALLAPDSVDVLMHRSQISLLPPTPDFEKSEADIRACLAKKPDHVVALLRSAMMFISQAQQLAMDAAELAEGNQNQLAEAEAKARAEARLAEAEDFVNKAKAIRPDMSEVYQVVASIAEVKGDVEAAIAAHDKAMGLDPKNPTPYMNKGSLLSQIMQPSNNEEMLMQITAVLEMYRQALKVDPHCSQAQKHWAETKMKVATTFEETEGIIAGLDEAVENCRDPQELVELCTLRCIAAAQLEGAKDLGMTSFADING